MTSYPISPAEWNALKATSPETRVAISVAADSNKNLKPGNKIIVRPLYDKTCGSVIVREIICVEKYQSGIAATIVVSGFKLRDDLSAYGGECAPTIRATCPSRRLP